MRSFSRASLLILGLVLFLAGDSATAQGRRRAVQSGLETAPAGPQVTTFAVIDQAAAEGRISPDQAMLYKIFAIYDDPRLPQEMRGDDSGIADILGARHFARSDGLRARRSRGVDAG